jgi:hypothetical protein
VAEYVKAFCKGFREVCGGDGSTIDQFTPSELQIMLTGREITNVNFQELEDAAAYKEPYSKDHPVIRRFWYILVAEPIAKKMEF